MGSGTVSPIPPVPPAETAGAALRVIEKIGKALDTLRRHCTKESEELVIRLPEHSAEFSIALKITSGAFGGKVDFSFPNMLRVQAHSLPSFTLESQAILQGDGKIVLDAGAIPKGTDTLLLSFEFEIEQRNVLESLVQTNRQLDPISSANSSEDVYWMSAQIRHPAYLEKVYSRLELYGVDFRLNVGVHQDVKDTMPQPVLRVFERSADFASTSDREKLLRLMLDQRRAVRQAPTIRDGARKLTELFTPGHFEKYVEVKSPYRLYTCERGTELYDLLYAALPKYMTVISRTDLTLDQPAQKGTLIYKKGQMKQAISEIFPS